MRGLAHRSPGARWRLWRESSTLIFFGERSPAGETELHHTHCSRNSGFGAASVGEGRQACSWVGPTGRLSGGRCQWGRLPLASTPREGLEHQLGLTVFWLQLQTCCDLGQETYLEQDASRGPLQGCTLAPAPYQQNGPRGGSRGVCPCEALGEGREHGRRTSVHRHSLGVQHGAGHVVPGQMQAWGHCPVPASLNPCVSSQGLPVLACDTG